MRAAKCLVMRWPVSTRNLNCCCLLVALECAWHATGQLRACDAPGPGGTQGYGNAPGWASQTGALQAAASKYGGFGNIAVGLCANDLEQYRGTGSVNDAFALTAWGRNKGTKGAFVWAWEDDQVGSATKGPWGMTGGINWLLSQGAQLLQIRNVHSNTCMAIWDGSNNMQAFMWACNAADHHQWFYWCATRSRTLCPSWPLPLAFLVPLGAPSASA